MSTEEATTEAVRRSVTVDCSVEHAFETFTERIHEWWPLAKHSISVDESGAHPPETVVFQGGAGGQIYERTADGEDLKWADVLAFDPPHRLVLAWNPSRERERPPTEIEVTFTAEGDRTLVELEHRGWERLGDRAAKSRQGYGEGWKSVLAAYGERASA
jgi:uncharacterized protein YndB with AHSA1/START domain